MIANYKTYDEYDSGRLYTLRDAETILNRRNQRKKRDVIYFLKQRLCGLALVLIGILCPVVLGGDATVSLFTIPVGIFLLITRQKVMNFKI